MGVPAIPGLPFGWGCTRMSPPSGRSSAWQSARFGTVRPVVQIHSPRPSSRIDEGAQPLYLRYVTPGTEPLTERQRQVLEYVRRRIEDRGVAPTLREIAEHFRFASTASAQKHVNELQKKGWLKRKKHQRRGLVPVEDLPPQGTSVELPLLGLVAAGQPIESLDVPATVSVPKTLVQAGEHYVLQVRGDSMTGDGILDGDLVVVQARNEARPGEMVVALVDGEVTLKRFYFEDGGMVRLQPANASMAPLRLAADRVAVQGIVVGLMRRYT